MQYTRPSLYVDGRWRTPAEAGVIEVRSPYTETVIGAVPTSSHADVDAAVSAATRATSEPHAWSRWSPDERADVLEHFADCLTARAEETARIVTAENGMPISMSSPYEGFGPAETLRYYAKIARETETEVIRQSVGSLGTTSTVRRTPLGVVAAIVPWNVPQSLSMFKIAPALAAGCAVILKPAPETPLNAFQLADAAADAGLPAGVLNVVTGGGNIGAYLVSHPSVHKVAFTGSVTAGRTIGEVCGRLLRPVTLELGGKSAAILLDDSDIQETVEQLAPVCLAHAGQLCYANTRILAPHNRYEEVVEALGAMASALPMGDPMDTDTFVGPLISEEHRDLVEDYIRCGRKEGRLVTGGRRGDQESGWFLEPTVFADVDNNARIAQEEIFGPVLTVIPYCGDAEAIRIANDSSYGLGGTVWTKDPERGMAVARAIETGTIGVNWYLPDLGAPFGGVKSSGLGREMGPEALDTYTSTTSIYRQR